MKKAISRFSLIKEQLDDNPVQGFLPTLFGRQAKNVDLFIILPQYDVLRAEMFIDDLHEIAEEYKLNYGIAEFINTLYDDFLLQIKRDVDLSHIYQYLQQKQAEFMNAKAREELIRTDNNKWSLKEVPTKEKKVRLCITLSRKAALRGEVFLYDLSTAYPSFQLTLEELLAILFIDVVTEIKKGNQMKFIKAILARYQ